MSNTDNIIMKHIYPSDGANAASTTTMYTHESMCVRRGADSPLRTPATIVCHADRVVVIIFM